MIKLDHLAVATHSLESGIEYFKKVYGLELVIGGQHPAMGTHNAVMKLDQDRYLELIAIDPRGQKPNRPRWFNLDSPVLQAAIKERPRLITWVARTPNFEELKSFSKVDIGLAKPMTRGELSWQFGFSNDGSLLEDGLLPYIIQWDSKDHVSRKMPEKGYSLLSLELNSPNPNKTKEQLASMGVVKEIKIIKSHKPSLRAKINTANGVVVID